MGNYKRNEENKRDSDQCGIYSITNILNGKRLLDKHIILKAIQSNCCEHTKTSQGYIWKYRQEVA